MTTTFTYSHANTPLDQSEHGWYLRYFVNKDVEINHLNIKVTRHINRRYHTLRGGILYQNLFTSPVSYFIPYWCTPS